MRIGRIAPGILAGLSMSITTGSAVAQDHAMGIALIKMPYTGARNVDEISAVPEYLEEGGIARELRESGATLRPTIEIHLTSSEEREYGEWHRMAMANAHLADAVATNLREGSLSVGLLANCTSLLGMLGGLQQMASAPDRVALVFIDAHADFNTPETTLSGMLGGMPVATAAGLGLRNVRMESGLTTPIPTSHIVMGALRDVDPLERELLDQSDVEEFTVEDIRTVSPRIHELMERLSESSDYIYVHVDMDVLDPTEVPGHPLTVAGGPTSRELAGVVEAMLRYEKVVAFGVASTPAGERDPEGVSRRAAYRLIHAAVRGAAK